MVKISLSSWEALMLAQVIENTIAKEALYNNKACTTHNEKLCLPIA